MNGSHRVHDPSLAVFLTEAGKIPLLDHEQEIVLGRELRERHRELELILLGSHYVWRKVLDWQELVAAGELNPAELMPRGRKTPAQAGAMRRRLRGTCRILRRALKGGAAAHDRAVAALETLNLNRKKLLALADELRDDARRRPAGAERGELLELSQRVAEAKERIAVSRTALVEANIRLAVSVAKR
ncbi:hypothetical protein EPO15_02645, partial [bacterium]